jgi:hypothetical protein
MAKDHSPNRRRSLAVFGRVPPGCQLVLATLVRAGAVSRADHARGMEDHHRCDHPHGDRNRDPNVVPDRHRRQPLGVIALRLEARPVYVAGLALDAEGDLLVEPVGTRLAGAVGDLRSVTRRHANPPT